MKEVVRIGAGAGYSGDRIEPAVELVEHAGLNYLVFECLGERTIALAQAEKLKDPDLGYDPFLLERMAAVLQGCARRGVKIITNMGAANPKAAARATARLVRDLGLGELRVAYVSGDDLHAALVSGSLPIEGEPPLTIPDGDILSANAYLGAGPIVEALREGADVVITGRVGDPSMFLAPLVHEFGWSFGDGERFGQGTLVGHLLECAGQITGGFFADPGRKNVEGLARLGFPFAEVTPDGAAVISKVAGSGGCITLATCKEQLLYEVHDPASYYQPDVVADFSAVRMRQEGEDRVAVTGGRGRRRTGKLKVSVGYRDGFIGEGQISYGGHGARKRGELAIRIVRERLKLIGLTPDEMRSDLIAMTSLGFDRLGGGPELSADPLEVRVRVAGRVSTRREAQRIGEEVENLYTNGPAGGGGAWKGVREIVAIASCLVPAEAVRPAVHFVGA
jgi:Acyclic terpene utilisation family protein AtuA